MVNAVLFKLKEKNPKFEWYLSVIVRPDLFMFLNICYYSKWIQSLLTPWATKIWKGFLLLMLAAKVNTAKQPCSISFTSCPPSPITYWRNADQKHKLSRVLHPHDNIWTKRPGLLCSFLCSCFFFGRDNRLWELSTPWSVLVPTVELAWSDSLFRSLVAFLFLCALGWFVAPAISCIKTKNTSGPVFWDVMAVTLNGHRHLLRTTRYNLKEPLAVHYGPPFPIWLTVLTLFRV